MLVEKLNLTELDIAERPMFYRFALQSWVSNEVNKKEVAKREQTGSGWQALQVNNLHLYQRSFSVF